MTKKPRKAQEGHLEEGKAARPTKARKAASQAKWQRRAKKSSKSKQTSKKGSNSKTQNSP
jgi:hypothetical protein